MMTAPLTGKALRAAVAEKAGYRFFFETRGRNGELAVFLPPGRESLRPKETHYIETTADEAIARGFWGSTPPEFERDISAAWQLITAMNAKDYWTVVSQADGVWLCRFDGPVGTKAAESGFAEAATDCEAICLAFLNIGAEPVDDY